MTFNYQSPVLLIIFNRPDTLKIVFDVIKKAKPSKLYVSADGPRINNVNDQINCEKARDIVRQIDWECEVHYRFLDTNLGCGYGPASAISWAFENEDRLIIIEDDCVPSPSLFRYHDYLLEKYKDDNRVSMISGVSQQNEKFFNGTDYIFSHYGHTWGWGTWKRCWKNFDIEMKDLPQFLNSRSINNVFFSKEEIYFYNKIFNKKLTDKNLKNHVWDFQFDFSVFSNGGLAIVPAKNLVEHIGFIGTHHISQESDSNQKAWDEFSIKREPKFVLANREYDYYHFRNYIKLIFGGMPFYKRAYRKALKITNRITNLKMNKKFT